MVQWKPLPGVPEREYPKDWHRVSSLVLVLAWLGVLALGGGLGIAFRGALEIALPLACIWFPDVLGLLNSAFPGPLSSVSIARPSPASFVRYLGWVVLIVLTLGRLVALGTS
jgi:hypothetical protein